LFERCLDRLEVGAGEALFVDDSLANVEGARAVGLTAIHYTVKERDIAEIVRILGL
jgi:HAD superfamily hydrolase (TIGR01509 family)